MTAGQDDPEDYFLPLTDQRVFGAGIKRKRVPFVPASHDDATLPARPEAERTKSAGARYLDIVLPENNLGSDRSLPPSFLSIDNRPAKAGDLADHEEIASNDIQICSDCSQRLAPDLGGPKKHESSMCHQLAMPHVQPPSNLPRTSVAARYLSYYGWDPDSRPGLGALGQGIKYPIKPKDKRDTIGLRERVDADDPKWALKSPKDSRHAEHDPSPRSLNAKQVRQQALDEKKRAEKLREKFYSRVDLEEVLGPID